jgi:hypothetical protein
MNWRLKIALTAVFSLVVTSIKAQDLGALEIGTTLHGVIAVGDTPIDNYNPKTSVALVARYNLPYRLAIRASFAPTYNYTDQVSDTPVWEVYKSTRAALGLEYHFSDFNVYDGRRQFTTYAMLGGTYQFGDFKPTRNWDLISKARLGAMGGFGAKFRAFPMLVISAEIAAGYLFSDDYDRLPKPATSLATYYDRSGNDWYLFPNLTITYTFGPKF